MDASGNLYGTTLMGGSVVPFGGTAFELTPPSTIGGNWNESILWSFGKGTDGQTPHAGLITDPSGNLYGTTAAGGAYSNGTVFEISNAVSTPKIIVKPLNNVFPDTKVGSTSTASVAVKNVGTALLVGAVNTPSAPFGLSGSGRFNLGPNAQATITLTFKPTSTTLAHHFDAVVSNAVINHGHVQIIRLQGTGTP
jgi:uncharacterized repeat protein (TIGR03803 family)